MSTPHNAANMGDIAKTILLPGDPLRAKFIAENYFENPVLFNSVRNMLGYTGTYKGKRVSVMGTGMGMPSMGLYSYELIHFYGVKNLIRVGSCGAITKEAKIGSLVFAQGACTDSGYAAQYKLPGVFSAISSFELLRDAVDYAKAHGFPYLVGNVFSSDLFYPDTPQWKNWAKMDCLAIEMESFALYCNAARANSVFSEAADAAVSGIDNSLSGKGNMLSGENNMLSGEDNTLSGEDNTLSGEGNMLSGKGNMLSGEDSKKPGEGSSPGVEKVRALGILTVSDSLVTGEETTPLERQNSFTEMAEIALEIAPQ